ncbi:protrudin isoform X4 [Sapajus apella]|uniref:Protrudin n=1 Tax=Sapajus apella TaxID=9515 RepID=A0A6J3I3A2_SAPAP|nr:protrudin isoform X4 [Sapajus apella]
MGTQPQSESRPGSGDGGGVGGGDFRTCDFRTAQGRGAAFVWGWPEETLRALVPLFLLLPDPGPSLTEPAVRMQTSEREGCGPEMSPSVMPEAPLESPPFPTKSTAFDLFNLVLSYKRLEIYLEPLKDAGDGVRYLLRWQMPLCSLLTCLGLNILFLTLNEGAWYSVGALMISVPALLGYLQEVCRARVPESELMRRKYHSVRQEDLQRVRLSRPEAVAEVKSFLIQLEAFLSRLCCTCEAAYRVLHWENPVVSSQFYGALLGMVCMLYLLPLCWVLALLNSTLFLGNVEFFRVVSEYRASLQRRMNPKQEEHAFESPPQPDFGGKGDLMDSTPALTPTESLSSQDLTPGSVEEAEEAEPDEEFKDAIEAASFFLLSFSLCFLSSSPHLGRQETHLVVLEDDEGAPCPADDELALQDNGFLSKNEVLRSKVSRLTERLRKRYPTNNFGNCTGCSATFSVLKKRRSCSNCGNSFCSRCCSFKVPKSSMGATAPEAQRETVFVCASCNQTLSK